MWGTAASAVPPCEARWKQSAPHSTKKQRPPPAAGPLYSRKNSRPLSRGLHVFLRLVLEFLSTIFRAKEIFPSRELRLEFGLSLVNFHSTNRVHRHDYLHAECIFPHHPA